jgi:phospholipid/cholesterol/gamma-HCH transport system substrate-binding protein
VRNRGDALGRNLSLVNDYFTRFNKDLPNFEHDIRALATAAGNYADATPDLLAMLRNFSVNARTFTVKQDVYAQFLAGSSDFARTATDVFGQNSDRLIRLAQVSKPVLDLYSQYSVVLECLPNGLAIYDRTRLEQAFGGGPYLHITLTPVGDRGVYSASDRTRKSDITSLTLPPNCFGLPYGNHGLHPVNSRYPGNHPSDNEACGGSPPPPPSAGCPPVGGAAAGAGATRKTARASHAVTAPSVNTSGMVATPNEQNFVSGLLAPMLGGGSDRVPAGLADLLIGPMLRGMAVSVS